MNNNQWYIINQQNQQNAILYSCLENYTSTPITNNEVVVVFGILVFLLILLGIVLYEVNQ
jgi:hypothetical protein